MKSFLTAVVASCAVSAPVMAQDLGFLLVNESSADLTGFYVSSASSNSWEDNLMAGGYLAPGYEIEVLIEDGLTTCVYDIRGSFDDGSEAQGYDLDLCELGEYVFTD